MAARERLILRLQAASRSCGGEFPAASVWLNDIDAVEKEATASAAMDAWVRKSHNAFLDEKEALVGQLVGIEFRQNVRVKVRRPRWMPDRLYRRLMRTIVIEEGPLDTTSRPLAGQRLR